VGIVGGVSLVSFGVKDLQQGTWLVAGVMVLLLIPIVVAVPDARLSRSALVPFSWSAFFAKFWVSPRKHPDFGWAWITRFLVWMGTALATIYLLFYLEDYLNYPDPAAGQATLILLYGVGTALTAVIGGKLSDRSGKRKIYVIVSSIVMGLSVLILAFVPSLQPPASERSCLVRGMGSTWRSIRRSSPRYAGGGRPGPRPRRHQHRQHRAADPGAGAGGPLVTGLGYPALFISTAIVMVTARHSGPFIKSGAVTGPAAAGTSRSWTDEPVVYEVYVRSFADSDGDGVGDLEGIRQACGTLTSSVPTRSG
jgi:hypothetical protein